MRDKSFHPSYIDSLWVYFRQRPRKFPSPWVCGTVLCALWCFTLPPILRSLFFPFSCASSNVFLKLLRVYWSPSSTHYFLLSINLHFLLFAPNPLAFHGVHSTTNKSIYINISEFTCSSLEMVERRGEASSSFCSRSLFLFIASCVCEREGEGEREILLVPYFFSDWIPFISPPVRSPVCPLRPPFQDWCYCISTEPKLLAHFFYWPKHGNLGRKKKESKLELMGERIVSLSLSLSISPSFFPSFLPVCLLFLFIHFSH